MNKSSERRIRRYNALFPSDYEDSEIERWCFLHGHPVEKGGLGRYDHLRNWVALLGKRPDYNPWMERQLETLCSDEFSVIRESSRFLFVSETGCAGASKTFTAGFFSFHWWAASPHDSAVILCTTTKTALRQRIWPVISELWSDVKIDGDRVGHLVDSRTKVVWKPGDDKHAIMAVAVGEGETIKAVNNIKGVHARRMLIVVDEAETTPVAIFHAIANLRKLADEFILVVIGNSLNPLDPHGRCCEPADGWGSVTIESDSWRTKGVSAWNIDPGVCLHFDGFKSPNVLAGRTVHKHIYRFEDWKACTDKPDYQNTVECWSHERGWWAPEGASDLIITPQMIVKYDGMGKHQFLSKAIPIAFLDPAFGGDDCVLQFAVLGDIFGERDGIQLTETVEIQVQAGSPHEADYQIARKVIEECRRRNVEPFSFGCDATGIGRGVHAILAGEWNPSIQRVEFGGNATDRASSTSDYRPSHELYDRFVTELWWRTREFLQGGQLKGLSEQASAQLSSRRYCQKGRRYSVETKSDYKVRVGRSPDHADCVTGICEVAFRLGSSPSTASAQSAIRYSGELATQADDLHSSNDMNDDDSPAEFFDWFEGVES